MSRSHTRIPSFRAFMETVLRARWSAFRHNTYFKDFAASVDLNEADEEYWENTYYDIVVQETDWDTIWKTPTGRESLSKDPAHKFKAEK